MICLGLPPIANLNLLFRAFFFYLFCMRGKNKDRKLKGSSAWVSAAQMKRSWTQLRQSVEGFYTAMKENCNGIFPYAGKKRSRGDIALLE